MQMADASRAQLTKICSASQANRCRFRSQAMHEGQISLGRCKSSESLRGQLGLWLRVVERVGRVADSRPPCAGILTK